MCTILVPDSFFLPSAARKITMNEPYQQQAQQEFVRASSI